MRVPDARWDEGPSDQPLRVAVIGAGISGLACAYELRKGGAEVVVYESEDHVGGRMATRVKDGFHFDIGADHLCDHYVQMKALCSELGVEWEEMRHVEYAVIRGKQAVPLHHAVSWWSKLKLAFQFFRVPEGTEVLDLNTVAEYDTQNAYDFVVDRCGQEVADYWVDAFCTAYEFHGAKEISVGALFALMDALKSRREDWDLQRTKGGMRALPEALAKTLDVRLSTPVNRVRVGEKPNEIIVEAAEGPRRYDKVVLACEATATRRILADPSDSQRLLLEAVRYASTISTAFRVDVGSMPPTTLFWVPVGESPRVASYANETMKGDQVIHDGKSLVSVWLHEGFAKELMDRSDEEIYSAVAEALLEVCPGLTSTEQLESHDLQRWPQAEPKFYHGYLRRVRDFLELSQGEDGVYFSGDYLNAPWTEGALRRGQQVARQILASQLIDVLPEPSLSASPTSSWRRRRSPRRWASRLAARTNSR